MNTLTIPKNHEVIESFYFLIKVYDVLQTRGGMITNLKKHREIACLGFAKLIAQAITTPKEEITLQNFGVANTRKVERVFISRDSSLPLYCHAFASMCLWLWILPGPNSSPPVGFNSSSSLKPPELLQSLSAWAIPLGFWFNRSRVGASELPTVTCAFQKNIRKITLQATIPVCYHKCVFDKIKQTSKRNN